MSSYIIPQKEDYVIPWGKHSLSFFAGVFLQLLYFYGAGERIRDLWSTRVCAVVNRFLSVDLVICFRK